MALHNQCNPSAALLCAARPADTSPGRVWTDLSALLPRPPWWQTSCWVLWALASLGLLLAAVQLSQPGRWSLIILSGAVIAWTTSRLGDAKIAILAVLALVVAGALPAGRVYTTLGSELMWLLIAAFVFAAYLRASGLLERLATLAAAGAGTLRGLLYRLTGAIALTAFLVPSTSARAALLLPVYLAIAARLESHPARRALALMFPTAILLSAGASLIGAGAHIIAADAIAAYSGRPIDFVGWAMLAAPFCMATTFFATWVIIRTFLERDAAHQELSISMDRAANINSDQRWIIVILVSALLLWMTPSLHGLGIGIASLAAMAGLMLAPIACVKPKDAFKSADLELIVFLAMTLAMADALRVNGADVWLARSLLDLVPSGSRSSTLALVALAAVVSVAAHLLINSRTARAGVLIPTLGVPLIGWGCDPTAIILTITLGTGFCQTLSSSAKPVAIFAAQDQPPFTANDLLRLSTRLGPMMVIALFGYGLLISR